MSNVAAVLAAVSLACVTLLTAQISPAYAQAMALGGQLDVGPNGSANYSIPVVVAPGTGGMVPALTLDYSSDGGNGLLGMGWSLGGLPSIGRCGKTIAQEGVRGAVNYDANDRFCMEGQKLFMTSGSTYGADGTEYKTEIEGFSKIIAHGTAGSGPAWFEVKTKSGQTMEFGNTTDSRILAQGTSTARSWAVNKITDTKGNYLTVTYTNDTTNGQAYPTQIDYTGNAAASLSPYNKVTFTYEDRPDVTPLYHAGSLFKTTKRLTHVKTWTGTTLINDYILTYEVSPATSRSRIKEIQLCAGATPTCLPKTTFTWSGQSGLAWDREYTLIAATDLDGTSKIRTGDWNGDGLTDIMAFTKTTGANLWFLKDASGGFTKLTNKIATAEISNCDLSFGDWNGDGIVDVLATLRINGNPYDGLNRWYTNDGSLDFTLTESPIDPAGLKNKNIYLGDWNADGRSDLLAVLRIDGNAYDGTNLWYTNDGSLNFTLTQNAIAETGLKNKNIYLDDWNGDGRSDLLAVLRINGNAYDGTNLWYTNNGSLTFSSTVNPISLSGLANKDIYLNDWNGDGKSDLLSVLRIDGNPYDGTNLWYTNNGSLTFAYTPNPIDETGLKNKDIYLGDWNSDGRGDLLSVLRIDGNAYDGTNLWYTNEGSLTFAYTPNPIDETDLKNKEIYFGDWNGDGEGDLLAVIKKNGNPYDGANVWFTSTKPFPDLITTFTSGLGVSTTITYTPLPQGGVYAKDSDATYPVVDVMGSSYVVSRVDAANGVGGVYSSTYTYAGAKSDLQGRGFLGFRQRVVTDLQTNVVQTTNYLQSYPYIGLVSSETKKLGSQTLNETLNTYSALDLGGTRRFPYLRESVASSFDLDSTAMPVVTTAYTYDSYGNPTTVYVSTPDGAHKTTNNTYTNDTTNWFLGRLTAAAVTSASVGTGGGSVPNTSPVASNDTLAVYYNVARTFDARINDSDVEGDAFTVTAKTNGAHGTVDILSGGTQLKYTPTTGYLGTDSFTYTITDSFGATHTATVNVTVDATTLLLHMDGTDAATAFPNSSLFAHTVGATGNAQVDTAQSKFGGASALFDGTGDYLTGDGSSDYAFGTGDFTIDFWVRLNATAGGRVLYDARPSGTVTGIYPTIYLNAGQIFYYTSGANRISGSTLATGAWYHVALVRTSGSTKLYVNGTQVGSTYTDAANYLSGTSARPVIGAAGDTTGNSSLNGWIDELRVSKGIARWTSSFTPPSSPY